MSKLSMALQQQEPVQRDDSELKIFLKILKDSDWCRNPWENLFIDKALDKELDENDRNVIKRLIEKYEHRIII